MGGYASRERTPPGTPRRGRLGARPGAGAGAPPPRPLLDEAALRDAGRWAHPHDVASPVRYRSPLQRSGIVQNVVNLDKHSLAVAPDGTGALSLQFDFSARVPGYVSVFFAARQVIHRGPRAPDTRAADAPVRKVSYVQWAPDGAPAPRAEKTRFAPGVALRYRQKQGRGMRVEEIGEERAVSVCYGHFPIVIRIEAKYPRDSTVPRDARIVSQCSFAALEARVDGGWGIKLLRQEVLVSGTIYVIQELYGIGAVDVTASTAPQPPAAVGAGAGARDRDNVFSVDAGNECVICLIEPCNTAVLPCNHLCLCQDCGAKLSTDPSLDRRRCPICRTDLQSLLRIIPTTLPADKHPDPPGAPAAGSTDAGAGPGKPGGSAAAADAGADACDEAAAAESENADAAAPAGGSDDAGAGAAEGCTTRPASGGGSSAPVPPEANIAGSSSTVGSLTEEDASLSSDISEATSRDEDGAVTPITAPHAEDTSVLAEAKTEAANVQREEAAAAPASPT